MHEQAVACPKIKVRNHRGTIKFQVGSSKPLIALRFNCCSALGCPIP
jgi:hypothetical protein